MKPEMKGETPYLAVVAGNSDYVKLGCSRDPNRRVTDPSFGKAPRVISRLIADKANRQIEVVFFPTKDATLPGSVLERKYHSSYEEHRIAGEWYMDSRRSHMVDFFVKHGYRPVNVSIAAE